MKESIITLENATHRAQLYPNRGGKTGSFVHKGTGFELLAQPKDGVYPELWPDMPFSEGDASGFDDVFPSMGGETISWDGREWRVPDHGEIWTMPTVAQVDELAVSFVGHGRGFPYEYRKNVSLEGDALRYTFEIINRDQRPLPCVWVCHCLMRWEEGVSFVFPKESTRLLQLFPEPGVADTRTSLRDYTQPPEAGQAMKFYFAQQVRDGRCAAHYAQSHMTAEMTFDPCALPYLGFWITTGAYRGDKNFAFEPSNGFFDTVARARQEGRLSELAPGDIMRFHLTLRLRTDTEIRV